MIVAGVAVFFRCLLGFLSGFCRLLFSLSHFLQHLFRILVETLLAAPAAEFDFLALVFEDVGLAHVAQLFAGDRAGFEFVRTHFRLLGVSGNRGHRTCDERKRGDGEGEISNQFHKGIFVSDSDYTFQFVFPLKNFAENFSTTDEHG
jgi:hypothetical protein